MAGGKGAARRGGARALRAPIDRAVIYHSLVHARAALAAAEGGGRTVVLLTAPGAHLYAGQAFLKGAVELAARSHPGASYRVILDCGDDAAVAFDAMREGWRLLLFTGRTALRVKLVEAGRRLGVEILSRRPAALDLLDRPEAEAACRAWLTGPAAARCQ